MAVEMFLKIDGIAGESTDSKHKGEIQLASFSWGLSNSGHAASGAGAGRATFEDFAFTANSSKASPQLMLACASGKHIPSAVLSVRRAGRDRGDIMTIKWSNLLVSFYKEQVANAETFPLDEVGLAFQKVEFTFLTQAPTGVTTPTTTTWNLTTGG